jgi:RHS repeat-associated protein
MNTKAGRQLGALVVAIFLSALSTARADVGRSPGQAGVSSTGVGGYKIPIWAPPGPGSTQPSLSFSYSHRGDTGLLGMGWRVEGFSLVTRCNKTKAQDGVKAAPSLVAADSYCLNGNKLRLESGTAGMDGAIYRTEMESYSRISAHGAAGGGPAWFRVRTKDGLTYEYGNSVDSRILVYGNAAARIWAVSSVQDAAGNRIQYLYTNDTANGSYRPDEIRYTINTAAGLTAAQYSVKFLYEDRPDPLYGYALGSTGSEGRINEFKRLDRVEVRYQGNPVRIYDVAYSIGAGGRSRVDSIKECATNLTACLAPTTFTYTQATAAYQAEVNLGPANSAHLLARGAFMDVTGDGRDDQITHDYGNWQRRVSTGATLAAAADSGVAADPNLSHWMSIDWDGDGPEDLLTCIDGDRWKVIHAKTDGTGFDSAVATGHSCISEHRFSTADLNGDGRDDLLWLNPDTGQLYVYYREGSTFAAPVLATLWTFREAYLLDHFDKQRMRQRRVDFNGDGREDSFVKFREDTSGGAIGYYGRAILSGVGVSPPMPLINNIQRLWFGDLNGDGLTDVARSGVIYYSMGNAFKTASGPDLSAYDLTARQRGGVIDYDGDGRDDLIVRHTASGSLHVFYGSGNGLTGPVDTGISMTEFSIADVNGDGFSDLAGNTPGGQFVLRLHSSTPADLLLTATDGFGVTATFTYAPLTDATVYTKGLFSTYPVTEIQRPDFVVKKLRTTDGSGAGTNDLDYTYSFGRYDHDGRGFLGFAQRIVTQTSGGNVLRTSEVYHQQFPFIGALQTAVVMQADGRWVRTTSNSWSSLSWGTYQVNARSFPYIAGSSHNEYEVGGDYNGTATSYMKIDVNAIDAASGLATDVTRTINELETGTNPGSRYDERIQHTSVFNDTTNWCLGKPAQTQVIRSHTMPGGTPLTRISSATWNGTYCRPEQTVVEPGNARWQVATNYGFDNFGNINAVTVTPAAGQGQAARTTTANWGAAGQFPMTVTNAKQQITSFVWDFALGNPLSATDPNSLVTSWEYDAYGRLEREQRPDLTATNFDLTWCNTAACQNGNATVRTLLTQTLRDTANAEVVRSNRYRDLFDREVTSEAQGLSGAFSTVRRIFDSRGLLSQVSMPFFPSEPVTYTTVSYDLLGRATLIRRPTSEADSSNHDTRLSYRGLSIVATDALNRSMTQRFNVIGQVIQMIDAAGSDTDYEYDAVGNLLKTRDVYGNEVVLAYNVRDLKETSNDPDMGAWTYDYFPLGELKSQTDAKGQTTTFTYDELSRPLTRVDGDGTTQFTYDTAVRGIGQRASASSVGYSESYLYDAYGRPSQTNITADSNTYRYDYGYHPTTGLLQYLTYPTSSSGFRFKVRYDYQYGVMQRVSNYTGDVLGVAYWEGVASNARGQYIDERFGNGLQTLSGYDRIAGWLDDRTTGPSAGTSIQNLTYQWNKLGSLTQRHDARTAVTENFYYDNLERLDYSTLNGATNLDLGYDAIGNITTKSDVGTYAYHVTKKHAVASTSGTLNNAYAYDANGNMETRNGQPVTWYRNNLLRKINSSATLSSEFSYGPDGARWKQVNVNGSATGTTTYIGKFVERLVTANVNEFRHYVYGPAGAVAVYKRPSSGTNPTTTYLTADHLGSLDVVVSTAGLQSANAGFSAFGERVGTSGSGAPPSADLTTIRSATRRGFTFHEHLDDFGVIHMNGRVYDPKIGRFMSADPFVQAPLNSQSFNRYSYGMNNPLSGTDPSGYEWDDTDVDWWWYLTPWDDEEEDEGYSTCSGSIEFCSQWAEYATCFASYGSKCQMPTQPNPPSEPYPPPGTQPGPVRPDPAVGSTPWAHPGREAVLAVDTLSSAQPSAQSWGQSIINSVVPGAYYAGQAELAFRDGRYLEGSAHSVASILEAGIGVFTFGRSTAALGAVRAIGFAPGTAEAAFTAMRNGGGHAIRHLQGSLIPNTGSLTSRLDAFKAIAIPILENPLHTANWRIGETMGRAFLGKVNGKDVVIVIAKEGPYQGQVISAFEPDANQLTLILGR